MSAMSIMSTRMSHICMLWKVSGMVLLPLPRWRRRCCTSEVSLARRTPLCPLCRCKFACCNCKEMTKAKNNPLHRQISFSYTRSCSSVHFSTRKRRNRARIFGHSHHHDEEKKIHATGDCKGTSDSQVLPEAQRMEFGDNSNEQRIHWKVVMDAEKA